MGAENIGRQLERKLSDSKEMLGNSVRQLLKGLKTEVLLVLIAERLISKTPAEKKAVFEKFKDYVFGLDSKRSKPLKNRNNTEKRTKREQNLHDQNSARKPSENRQKQSRRSPEVLKKKKKDRSYEVRSDQLSRHDSRLLADVHGKKVIELSSRQRHAFANSVFGSGPAVDLLSELDHRQGGGGISLLRMVSLGIHEGGLRFLRLNDDPANDPAVRKKMGLKPLTKWAYNKGTFQISAQAATREKAQLAVEKKYDECLRQGKAIYNEVFPKKPFPRSLTPGNSDLLAHIGYIYLQGGKSYDLFEKLADQHLNRSQVKNLMSNKIQVGASDIGYDVYGMTAGGGLEVKLDNASDDALIASNQNRSRRAKRK